MQNKNKMDVVNTLKEEKMKVLLKGIVVLNLILFLVGCKKKAEPEEETQNNKLIFSVQFDETLPRLGNLGEEVAVESGNAAQHPAMKEVSLHYIELAKDSLTPLGSGAIVYKGAETNAGGEKAVDFEKASIGKEGEGFITVNLNKLPIGTYKWIRVSLTYQKYDIAYRYNNPPYFVNADLKGTLASFVGYNTYIKNHKIKDSTLSVNADKLQGFWAFETGGSLGGVSYGTVVQGEAEGTTVVNPIATTSPVPAGSCIVTGRFDTPLVITGNETSDVEIVLAFSINNSFEWKEVNVDGKFEPSAGEAVVDMGLRGLHPKVK